jgi:hypothetical protein
VSGVGVGVRACVRACVRALLQVDVCSYLPLRRTGHLLAEGERIARRSASVTLQLGKVRGRALTCSPP